MSSDREVRIKMCGMFRAEDIKAVNDVRPDYCGFVVDFPKSHRSVDRDMLKKLRALLSDGITAVGVFVDEETDDIISLLDDGTIDIAQLHGNESDETIVRIKERTGKSVIRAYRMRAADKHAKDPYEELLKSAQTSPADMILLDTGQGGGVAMDFEALRAAAEKTGFSRPYFLAGGITSENICEAIRILHPFAIDLSGGLETERLKDPAKMREIMELVKK